MTKTPSSPRLLLLCAAVLTIAGIAILSVPHGQESPPSAPASATTAAPSEAAPARFAGRPPARAAPPGTSSAAAAPSVHESFLPPHGEGAAGDRAIQHSLAAAWPADLPSQDQRVLLTAGRALLRADATGVGRAQWPDVFPDSGQAVAPAFAPGRFRVQAAIARRDGSPAKAMVHLVWAGTDRGGTFTDNRITDLCFTRTTSTKGASTWTPQPRT